MPEEYLDNEDNIQSTNTYPLKELKSSKNGTEPTESSDDSCSNIRVYLRLREPKKNGDLSIKYDSTMIDDG